MPAYRLVLSPPFERSLSQLARRYPHAPEDVQVILNSLKMRPEQGDAVPRWRRRVWKVRVNSRDIRRGKRFGFRLIYYLETRTVTALLIYAKPDKSNVSDRKILHALQEIGRTP